MSAARKQAFNRSGAIASIQINWPKLSPGGDRDERLAWISEYLGREIGSLKDLSDNQLRAVAGEMKRLTGQGTQTTHPTHPTASSTTSTSSSTSNVVNFGSLSYGQLDARNLDAQTSSGEISHAASHEQVFTLMKLQDYLNWPDDDMAAFLRKRFNGCSTFRMLRFKQATAATHILLRVAAQQDLKKRSPGEKIGREAIAKYVPLLKEQLGIDQGR